MIDQRSRYPEVKSLTGDKPKKLLVMLHGVGSDGDDLIGLAPFIQKHLPDYHFISPHGIEEYDGAPYGRQWFSLKDRSSSVIMGLIEKNAASVIEIIKSKQQELNLDNADTILFGFSQGTMLASYLTLNASEPYGAMIGFAGYLCPPKELKNKSTPICIVHGEDDPVVSVEESTKFANYCRDNDIVYQLKTIPNLTHSIDASGLKFAINFLKTIDN